MARIRATQLRDGTRVNVSGRLGASDMGRLEHACRDALTREPLRLDLDLTRVTEVDATATAVITRLRQRGAQVRTVAGASAQEASDSPPPARVQG